MKRNSIQWSFQIVGLVIFLFTYPHNALAQENENCTLIGKWAKGPCFEVKSQNNHAFFNEGCFLRIADITDPGNPLDVSEIVTPTVINAILVKSNYVFVANIDSGLGIIDISDIQNPKIVSYVPLEGYDSFLSIRGDVVFFSTSNEVHAIDITDANNPVEIGMIEQGAIRSTVFGDYLYLADRGDGCAIVDVSNPQNMMEIGRIEEGSYYYDVAVQDDYAYLAISDSLLIYNISAPDNPQFTGAIDGRYISRCIVQDDIVFMAEGAQRRLKVVDVSDPANPVLLSYHNSKIIDNLHGLNVQAGHIYAA